MSPLKKAQRIILNEDATACRAQETKWTIYVGNEKGKGKKTIFDWETSPRGPYDPSRARELYAVVQTFFANRPLEDPSRSSTVVSLELTSSTKTQDQSDAPGN